MANELKTLQDLNNKLIKEREALQVILEQKIFILVQSISSSIESLGPINGTKGEAYLSPLIKDISTLTKLVQATNLALSRHQFNSNQEESRELN